jgi:hypothetical protein
MKKEKQKKCALCENKIVQIGKKRTLCISCSFAVWKEFNCFVDRSITKQLK